MIPFITHRLPAWLGAITILFSAFSASADEQVVTKDSFGKQHALTMYGEPKYGPDFTHFEYANPNAPRGGRINLDHWRVFDTLNPWSFKGIKAPGFNCPSCDKPAVMMRYFQRLMVRSYDEPYTFYGLVAETAEVAKDRSWVEFVLRKEARFHDDTPITADDVVFTYNALLEKGDPMYKVKFALFDRVEKIDRHTVRFHFKVKNNRQLPVMAADLPVLSKAFYSEHSIDETTLKPPLGSGPYKISDVDQGRSITYERWESYWGWNLPVNRGMYNFDTIHYQPFRDGLVALEAIKSGTTDLRKENSSRSWTISYNIPAVERGDLIKDFVQHQLPQGNQAFYFNNERYPDRRVREAIAISFDFDWINEVIMYGMYSRNHSFYTNTEFAQRGTPSEAELKLLEPFRDILPERVFTEEYRSPSSEREGLRNQLVRAQKLLNDAGYIIKDNVRVHKDTGEELTLNIMLYQRGFERLVAPMVHNLKILGIPAKITLVEVAQWQRRVDNKDFDMMLTWHGYHSQYYPGPEQRTYWHSAMADVMGSKNYIQLKHPAVDAMIDAIEGAQNLEELTAAARALDRILLWEFVSIPQYHVKAARLVYWDKFNKPDISPILPLEDEVPGLRTWWMKPANEITIKTK